MVEQVSTYGNGTFTQLLTALAYSIHDIICSTAVLAFIFKTRSALQIYVTLFLNDGINYI